MFVEDSAQITAISSVITRATNRNGPIGLERSVPICRLSGSNRFLLDHGPVNRQFTGLGRRNQDWPPENLLIKWRNHAGCGFNLSAIVTWPLYQQIQHDAIRAVVETMQHKLVAFAPQRPWLLTARQQGGS